MRKIELTYLKLSHIKYKKLMKHNESIFYLQDIKDYNNLKPYNLIVIIIKHNELIIASSGCTESHLLLK